MLLLYIPVTALAAFLICLVELMVYCDRTRVPICSMRFMTGYNDPFVFSIRPRSIGQENQRCFHSSTKEWKIVSVMSYFDAQSFPQGLCCSHCILRRVSKLFEPNFFHTSFHRSATAWKPLMDDVNNNDHLIEIHVIVWKLKALAFMWMLFDMFDM